MKSVSWLSESGLSCSSFIIHSSDGSKHISKSYSESWLSPIIMVDADNIIRYELSVRKRDSLQSVELVYYPAQINKTTTSLRSLLSYLHWPHWMMIYCCAKKSIGDIILWHPWLEQQRESANASSEKYVDTPLHIRKSDAIGASLSLGDNRLSLSSHKYLLAKDLTEQKWRRLQTYRDKKDDSCYRSLATVHSSLFLICVTLFVYVVRVKNSTFCRILFFVYNFFYSTTVER